MMLFGHPLPSGSVDPSADSEGVVIGLVMKVGLAVFAGVLNARYLLAQAIPDGDLSGWLDNGAAVGGLTLAGFLVVWLARGKLVPERLVGKIVADTVDATLRELERSGRLSRGDR